MLTQAECRPAVPASRSPRGESSTQVPPTNPPGRPYGHRPAAARAPTCHCRTGLDLTVKAIHPCPLPRPLHFLLLQVVRKGTGLPLFAEAGLVMARETAKELLQVCVSLARLFVGGAVCAGGMGRA